MRPLLLILLVAFATLLASSDAVSASTNSDKKQVSQLDFEGELLARALAVNNENGKRLLRGEGNEKIVATGKEEAEERAIMVRISTSISKLKAKLQNVFYRRFKRMVKNGDNPDIVRERYQIGTWVSLSRNRKLHRRFTVWYKKEYPGWKSKYE